MPDLAHPEATAVMGSLRRQTVPCVRCERRPGIGADGTCMICAAPPIPTAEQMRAMSARNTSEVRPGRRPKPLGPVDPHARLRATFRASEDRSGDILRRWARVLTTIARGPTTQAQLEFALRLSDKPIREALHRLRDLGYIEEVTRHRNRIIYGVTSRGRYVAKELGR